MRPHIATPRAKAYITPEFDMRALATFDRSSPRVLAITGLVAGVLLGSAFLLWLRYGSAVFHEMIVAGLALCF